MLYLCFGHNTPRIFQVGQGLPQRRKGVYTVHKRKCLGSEEKVIERIAKEIEINAEERQC